MKKHLKRLSLTRETLHLLSPKELGRDVVGGTDEGESIGTDGVTRHSCATTPYQTCPVYN
jgi:hypothetical protein